MDFFGEPHVIQVIYVPNEPTNEKNAPNSLQYDAFLYLECLSEFVFPTGLEVGHVASLHFLSTPSHFHPYLLTLYLSLPTPKLQTKKKSISPEMKM